jgi:heme-degrading monooxygenase HmoA
MFVSSTNASRSRDSSGESAGPIVFFNIFNVAPEEVAAFLDAWRTDGEFMQRQPGYVSTQPHRGVAGSTTFINVAAWSRSRRCARR